LSEEMQPQNLSFTPASMGFSKELGRIAALMAYALGVHRALMDEEVRSVVAGALGNEPEELEPDAHTAFVRERMLCAVAETFQWYLVSLLRTVFTIHPYQMLARSELCDDDTATEAPNDRTIPLRLVLECDTREQLLDSIIEDRVDRLAYKSLKALDAYFRKALKLPLTDDAALFTTASRAVAARNLIVHNRGIINRRFQTLWGDDAPPLGERFNVDDDFLQNAYQAIGDVVADLDLRAALKYLQGTDVKTLERVLELLKRLDGRDADESAAVDS